MIRTLLAVGVLALLAAPAHADDRERLDAAVRALTHPGIGIGESHACLAAEYRSMVEGKRWNPDAENVVRYKAALDNAFERYRELVSASIDARDNSGDIASVLAIASAYEAAVGEFDAALSGQLSMFASAGTMACSVGLTASARLPAEALSGQREIPALPAPEASRESEPKGPGKAALVFREATSEPSGKHEVVITVLTDDSLSHDGKPLPPGDIAYVAANAEASYGSLEDVVFVIKKADRATNKGLILVMEELREAGARSISIERH